MIDNKRQIPGDYNFVLRWAKRQGATASEIAHLRTHLNAVVLAHNDFSSAM